MWYDMSPLIHLIATWILAVIFLSKLNDRRIVVLAGIISDIDGFFILFSQDLFLKYHHSFAHSLIFGIPFILILSLFASNKFRTRIISLLAFSLHLALDIIGTNWPINPLYPIFNINLSIYPLLSIELIYWIIDPIFAVIIFIVMAWMIIKKEKSPVEFISSKLDKIITGFFIYPFKYRCKVCNKRASYYCEICKHYFCPTHVNKYFALKCKDCELK